MAKQKKEDVLDEGADNIDKFDIVTDKSEKFAIDENSNDINNEQIIPDIYDSKWSEYVLSQFEDNELIDGNPKAEGLRRVVGKLLGPIIRSVPVREVAPSIDNNNRATVAWEIDIKWQLDDSNEIRTFGDIADVSEDNTNKEYAIHASATAATRAEGRALRKALGLRQVIAAEEASSISVEKTNINNSQIAFMDMMCGRLDINPNKLIKMSKDSKIKKVEDIPYATAVLINKYLSECQRGKDAKGNPRIIPDSIKGYDSNWRKE